MYGHRGFLAAEDISEETLGKIIYPFSRKQKSDKMWLTCVFPIPSLSLLLAEEKKLQLFIPASVWNHSPVFSKGSTWSELFPITEFSGLSPPQSTPFTFLFMCSVFQLRKSQVLLSTATSFLVDLVSDSPGKLRILFSLRLSNPVLGFTETLKKNWLDKIPQHMCLQPPSELLSELAWN